MYLEENKDAGATTAPPAAAPAAVPGAEPISELDMADVLALDDTGEEVPPAPALKVAPAPPVPDPKPTAAPVVPPVVTAPAAPAAPVVQAPPVVAPVAPAPAVPEAPAAPAPAAAPDFAALRQAEHTRLTTAYALSEEDSRMMALEPEKVIPKLAASLHIQVFEAVMHGITSYLPQIIEAQTQQRTVREGVRNEFFTEFPALKDGKFERDVEAALVTYRQFNPQATRAQAITHAGVHVSLAHGIALPEKYFKGMAGAVAPVPGEVHSAAPFVPAAPGSSQTPAPLAPSNYFAKIAEEELAQDL